MNINYFTLFKQKENLNIDEKYLDNIFNKLMKEYHPDKHTNKSSFEQKQIMMMATLINDGYKTLKSPTSRLLYILKQNGINVELEEKTNFDNDFLMKQLEWREALDDANDISNIEEIKKEVKDYNDNLLQEINILLEEKKYSDIKTLAYNLMFVEKMLQAIEIKRSNI